jgi:hypothetical protein
LSPASLKVSPTAISSKLRHCSPNSADGGAADQNQGSGREAFVFAESYQAMDPSGKNSPFTIRPKMIEIRACAADFAQLMAAENSSVAPSALAITDPELRLIAARKQIARGSRYSGYRMPRQARENVIFLGQF